MTSPIDHHNVQQFVQFLREQHKLLPSPMIVALDGRSGSGKSTLARLVADVLNANHPDAPMVTVIEGDQFYAGGSDSTWDARSAQEKAANVIDWRRQYELLTALREQGVASWQAFDWGSETWDAEPVPLKLAPIRTTATDIILLEGAYSARPELADVTNLRVLVTSPDKLRRARLQRREGEAYQADWEARWSEAEAYYFSEVMPEGVFDLVLVNT
jgi:uridine kinase